MPYLYENEEIYISVGIVVGKPVFYTEIRRNIHCFGQLRKVYV